LKKKIIISVVIVINYNIFYYNYITNSDILSLKDIESDVETDDRELFARSPKSKGKIIKKGKKKGKSIYDDDDDICYVSKQTMSECLTTCDAKTDANEKLTCQTTCQNTLKDSE